MIYEFNFKLRTFFRTITFHKIYNQFIIKLSSNVLVATITTLYNFFYIVILFVLQYIFSVDNIILAYTIKYNMRTILQSYREIP